MKPYYWAYSPQTLNWEQFFFENSSGYTNDPVRRCLCNACIKAFAEGKGKNFSEVFES